MAGVIRLFHKRGSNGERTVKLSDLEHRVWFQYVMSADDYGVMRASASVLRADNRRLELEPLKRLEKAMEAVVDSSLVLTFTHQGTLYWWQADWQDFQQVQYPKDTILPAPPADVLSAATPLTRELFSVHHLPSQERKDALQAFRKNRKKPSGNKSTDSFQEENKIVRASRETHTQTQTQTPPGFGSWEEIPISTEPPAWGRGPRRADPALRDLDYHRRNCPVNPPWAASACEAGICLPKYLWPQLERRVGMAPDVLRAFVEAWALKAAPGDTAEKFWPWAVEQHFGSSVQAKPVTREQRTLAASVRTSEAIARGEL